MRNETMPTIVERIAESYISAGMGFEETEKKGREYYLNMIMALVRLAGFSILNSARALFRELEVLGSLEKEPNLGFGEP